MIAPEKITDIMGLSCNVQTLSELNELIIKGLPKTCLIQMVKHLSSDTKIQNKIQNRLISPATFKRRKDVLNAQESESVERMARIYALSLDVWGDQDDARQYLFTPNPQLNNDTPIDISFTELGARLVEEMIEKMRYGLPV